MLNKTYFKVAAICGDKGLSRYKTDRMILSTSGAAAASNGKVAVVLNPGQLNGQMILIHKVDALMVNALDKPHIEFNEEPKLYEDGGFLVAQENDGCQLLIPYKKLREKDMPDIAEITEKNQNPKLKEGCKSTTVKIDLLMDVLRTIKEMSSSETVDIHLANSIEKVDYSSSLRIEGETHAGPVVGTIMPLWKY
ncbi:MAG: hypothetical protein GF375_04950 [Candidatus Omnitrophica bacterium]|nr:hypothetical protein [Candidatus Omnitrophota bacterium]